MVVLCSRRLNLGCPTGCKAQHLRARRGRGQPCTETEFVFAKRYSRARQRTFASYDTLHGAHLPTLGRSRRLKHAGDVMIGDELKTRQDKTNHDGWKRGLARLPHGDHIKKKQGGIRGRSNRRTRESLLSERIVWHRLPAHLNPTPLVDIGYCIPFKPSLINSFERTLTWIGQPTHQPY